MEEKVYWFSTIAEIYEQLDGDQIERCFKEFAKAFSAMKHLETAVQMTCEDMSGAKLPPQTLRLPIRWTDDGKNHDHIGTVLDGDGKPLYVMEIKKDSEV